MIYTIEFVWGYIIGVALGLASYTLYRMWIDERQQEQRRTTGER